MIPEWVPIPLAIIVAVVVYLGTTFEVDWKWLTVRRRSSPPPNRITPPPEGKGYEYPPTTGHPESGKEE